jgi:hypothetical protein
MAKDRILGFTYQFGKVHKIVEKNGEIKVQETDVSGD